MAELSEFISRKGPVLIGVIFTAASIVLWLLFMVATLAFTIYGKPLNPAAPGFFVMLQVKYFPVIAIGAFVVGVMLSGSYRLAPVIGATLPLVCLVVSVATMGMRPNIDWDTFSDPADRAFIKDCASGSAKSVARHIADGRDPNVAGVKGLNPLLAAYIGGNEDAFVYLLDHGADPNRLPGGKLDFHVGNYLLDPFHPSDAKERFLTLLLDHGMDPNLGDADSRLLHTAAAHPDPRSALLLIERGGDPDARNVADLAPIAVAALQLQWDTALALFDKSNEQSLTDAAAIIEDQNARTFHGRDDPRRLGLIARIKAKGIDFPAAQSARAAATAERVKKYMPAP